MIQLLPRPPAPLLGLCLTLISSFAPLALRAADAQAFDRYTQGRTIHFAWEGQAYGVERYLPDRRVIWSFLDGRCVDGDWYPQESATGPQICFIYEGRDAAQCWDYEITGEGLSVSIQRGDGPALRLTEQLGVQEEMFCLGPEVGV